MQFKCKANEIYSISSLRNDLDDTRKMDLFYISDGIASTMKDLPELAHTQLKAIYVFADNNVIR